MIAPKPLKIAQEREVGTAVPLSGCQDLRRVVGPTLFRRHVGVRDSIVPAQGVFIQEDPCIAHSQGDSREPAGQNAPAPKGSGSGSTVEPCKLEARESQSRRAGG